MPERSLAQLAEKMRDIDFTMLATRSEGGTIAARPMSNNREVEYDGTSWFFTEEKTLTVSDIRRDAKVAMTFQARGGLLGQRPFFAAIEGEAALIQDKARFAEHWTKDLDRWFADGIDTPGLVMIEVRATRAHYWDGEDEGEVRL